MQPLLDRVLVLPRKAEETTTQGGLTLLASKVILEGKVIRVGPGRAGEPMGVTADDDVIWKAGAGVPYKEWLVLEQREILMIVGGTDKDIEND